MTKRYGPRKPTIKDVLDFAKRKNVKTTYSSQWREFCILGYYEDEENRLEAIQQIAYFSTKGHKG